MKIFNKQKPLLFFILITAAVSLIAIYFLSGQKGFADEEDKEPAAGTQSRLITENGETIIVLNKETQEKSGITSAFPASASHQKKLKAYVTVLNLQDLIELHNRYSAAKAEAEKAEANLDASRKNYERLKGLNGLNRNISDKVFQEAEAAWRSDEANNRSAQANLSVQEYSARQQWGNVLAKSAFEKTPAFERLIKLLQDKLLLITLPPGVRIESAPQTISVQISEGELIQANLISPSPRTDPHIQGISFYYVAQEKNVGTGMSPGMNLIAYMPEGKILTGVIVPSNAVIWWQGKAWIYVQSKPDNFIRRNLPTDMPVKEGWFVSDNLLSGNKVVENGAQLLLSEEFRSQIEEEE